MTQPVVVLIGNGTAAVQILRVLREIDCLVPLVLADPQDTGVDTWRLSLVGECLRLGYERGTTLFLPQNPCSAETIATIRSYSPDLVLSVQCARILRRPLITTARRGVVNLHNAPLPLLRGCDPFSWAIHDGLLEMGVTLHQILDEGVDNGPILAQRRWSIAENATAWDLYLRALDEAKEIARENIRAIVDGSLAGIPQDVRCVTYHPMGQFSFDAMEIQWNQVATTLSAWIRARVFPPFQLPFFIFTGGRVEVLRCRRQPGRGRPGEILSLRPLTVGSRFGSIELVEVRYEKTIQSGAVFANHVGLTQGEILSGPVYASQ